MGIGGGGEMTNVKTTPNIRFEFVKKKSMMDMGQNKTHLKNVEIAEYLNIHYIPYYVM